MLKLEWDWRRDLTRSSAPIGKIAKREYWLDLGFRICDLMKSAEFWNFGLYAPWDPHRGLLVLRKDLRAPFVVSKDLLELFRDLLALQQDLFALLLDPHADPPTPHRYPHDWQKMRSAVHEKMQNLPFPVPIPISRKSWSFMRGYFLNAIFLRKTALMHKTALMLQESDRERSWCYWSLSSFWCCPLLAASSNTIHKLIASIS